MSKKTRMGRNLNALLGSSTRTRDSGRTSTTGTTEENNKSSVAEAKKPAAEVASVSRIEAEAETGSSPAAKTVSEAATASTSASTDASANTNASASANTTDTANKASNPAVDLTAHVESTQALSAKPEAGTSASSAPSHEASTAIDAETVLQTGDKLRILGVDQISRGTYQPRRHFDQTLLQELADSIKAQGLIQPILVRPYGGAFELIAGERRWRATQLAGITEIPAIVRDLDDQSVAAVSLIENIQRADLNPLEEATALERLCEEFSMTHQAVAEAVGRSRASVTNLMRLLELDEEVKMLVDEGKIDMGHARALLGAPANEQATIARRIVSQGMTVRAVEKLVKDIREGKNTDTRVKSSASDPNIEALRRKLGDILGAPVAVKHSKSGSGTLEITYSSVDELEGILRHIK